MILATDVHYLDHGATVAGVAFNDWHDAVPMASFTSHVAEVQPYEPGAFYQRELPCLLTLLREHAIAPDCIVVDGYVFLDGAWRPGLGKHLFDALSGSVPVVGVAKTAFAGIGTECGVLRGNSQRPLFVTSVGMPTQVAQASVKGMHGEYRIPTLLALVDRLCRSGHQASGTPA